MSGFMTNGTAGRLAAFAAPAALVGAVILAAPAESPEADAVSVPASPAEGKEAIKIAVPRRGLSGEAAADYDAEVARLAALDRVAAPFPVEADRPAPAEDEPAAAEPETPELHLTSVMAGMRGGVCVINGAVLGVGDAAAPGWSVAEIEADARRVTLEGPGGVRVTLTQRAPGE